LPQRGLSNDDHHKIWKKLKVPSTFQIKHQLLLFWLKNQVAKEAAESEAEERVASRDRAMTAEGSIRATRLTPPLAAPTNAPYVTKVFANSEPSTHGTNRK
jgi:hypothetical protein